MLSIDPEHHQRVEAVLHQVMTVAETDRAASLDALCAGDTALRAHVDRLLDAYARADRFMETPDFEAMWPDDASGFEAGDDPDALTDLRFGSYKVLDKLGAGGMGTVFLARAEGRGFARDVAVKVLNRSVESAEARKRFAAEQQILALVEHPHVARLYDGGMTTDGRPYLVMECVRGVPITSFCDQQQLGITQRLVLFETVCEAVQAIHQHLVVHRDLKPGNILVTDEGVVKLLDFGIAKLLAEPASATTMAGPRPMTVAYASPEQLRGQAITIGSDVFSLGVLLCELLAGCLPWQADQPPVDPIASRGECLELCQALARAERADEIAHRRCLGSADALRRRLTGDLSTIVAKAMADEPGQRYESAKALADDLERHRTGRVVRARPASWHDRLAKLMRRNRAATAAITLAALTLIVASTLLVRQAVEVRLQRDRAIVAQAKAERVAGFFSRAFRLADPSAARGRTVTVREMIAKALDSGLAELDDQPGVQAELLQSAGDVYRNLGLIEEAAPLLEQVAAIRRETMGPRAGSVQAGSAQDLASALVSLARLRREQGALAEGEALHQEGVDRMGEALGAEHPEVAQLELELAWYQLQRGDFAGSEALARRTREAIEAAGPDPRAARHLHAQAQALLRMGRRDEAAAALRQAVAYDEVALPALDPEALTTRKTLAQVLSEQDELVEAEKLFRDVLAGEERIFPDHPRIAFTLNGLGVVLERQARMMASEGMFRRALDVRRARLGDRHPAVAVSLGNLARVREKQGDLAEAETLYRDSLAIARGFPPGSVQVSFPLVLLGSVLTRTERAAEAEPMLREAVAVRAQAGMAPDLLARAEMELAACLFALERPGESETFYQAALARLPDENGDLAARIRTALALLAPEPDA